MPYYVKMMQDWINDLQQQVQTLTEKADKEEDVVDNEHYLREITDIASGVWQKHNSAEGNWGNITDVSQVIVLEINSQCY